MIDRSNNFDEVAQEALAQFDITTISDDALQLCFALMKHPRLVWGLKVNEKKQMILTNNLKNFCTIDWNISAMLEMLNNGEEDKLFWPPEDSGTFTTKTFCRLCNNTVCPHSECIKGVLAALLLLRENGQLVNELGKRKDNVGFFKFTWNCTEDLRHVSEEIFQLAMVLLNNNCIYIEPRLVDKFMYIYTPFYCRDYHGLTPETLQEKINGLKIDATKPQWPMVKLKRYPNYSVSNLCSTGVVCGKCSCPIVTAARLYYLKMTGQWELVEKERKQYRANMEQVENAARTKYQEAMNKFNSNSINTKIVESFKELQHNTENLDTLVQAVANKDRTNLYFAIEREEGIASSTHLDKILDALTSTGRVTKSTNLTIGTLYNDNSKLPNEELTIITGISHFKNTTHDKYKEKTALIDLLSQPKKNRYIVIIGTKIELDWLSQYSPKLKYVYEHFRIKISDLTTEQLYDIYKDNLDSSVFTKAMSDEANTRARFVDFVENNRSIFPFKNADLAKYMAQYSNACGCVEFPPYVYKTQTLDEALSSIIGMENVKKQMKELEQYISFTNKAKARGLKVSSMNLHMLFTGNPGTGKTMMARIMARMLFDIGMIKENKMIEVERKDLIGEFIGKTAPKTAAVIERAMGGVLFIDEAYTLTPRSENDYGHEAIATLIKAMEDHKDELVVIFAGYKNEMFDFVESNPGIASRIGYTFDFPDYKPDELMEIFKIKMSKNGFAVSETALQKAFNLAEHISKRRNFGNGRFVDKLVQQTITNHATHTTDDDLSTVREDSIPNVEEFIGENSSKEKKMVALDDIVGMESLKAQIIDFSKYIEFTKKAKEAGLKLPAQSMHMVFTGNPGCGKTTIARIVAKMLYDLDILHENKLIETERKDFIGEYIGQTAPKVEDIINRAMGGVLFIDEAYTLTPRSANDYAHEAIAALIKAMEDNKDNLIVIFAGYKNEMKSFIDSNPGIASRVGYTFDFPDYTAEELLDIYKLKITKSGLKLTDNAVNDALKLMKYFHRVDNIGNGRFVDRVVQNTLTKHAKLVVDEKVTDIQIVDSESLPTVDEIIATLSNGSSMLKPDQVDKQSIKKTAIHEIGHAFVGYYLNKDTDIIRITVNAEGSGTLGYVLHKADNSATHKKTELRNKIKRLLAGMCCEEVFNGEFETGNYSDLEKATQIAKNMVTKHGMSNLGYAQIAHPDDMAELVHKEINVILNECYLETKKIITDNQKTIALLARFLLEKKEITGEEFVAKLKEIENLP